MESFESIISTTKFTGRLWDSNSVFGGTEGGFVARLLGIQSSPSDRPVCPELVRIGSTSLEHIIYN